MMVILLSSLTYFEYVLIITITNILDVIIPVLNVVKRVLDIITPFYK